MSTISKNRLGSDLGCKAYTEHCQFYLEVSLVADGRSLVADTVMIGSTGYYKTPQEFSYCFHRVGSFCIFTGTRSVELTELQERTFLYALLFSNKNMFFTNIEAEINLQKCFKNTPKAKIFEKEMKVRLTGVCFIVYMAGFYPQN